MSETLCGDNLSLNWELHHQEGLYQELPPTSTMNLDTRSPLEIINSDFESFSNFVKFGHVNAVTVPGNKDEIERTLIGSDFDIFAVTETNIHQNTPKIVYMETRQKRVSFDFDCDYTISGLNVFIRLF